jgi:hypothetical protein
MVRTLDTIISARRRHCRLLRNGAVYVIFRFKKKVILNIPSKEYI